MGIFGARQAYLFLTAAGPYQRITAGPLYDAMRSKSDEQQAAIVHRLQTEPRDAAAAALAAGRCPFAAGFASLERVVWDALGIGPDAGQVGTSVLSPS